MDMLSLCQTPVVQTDRGPKRKIRGCDEFPSSSKGLFCLFSSLGGGKACRRGMRLARTTSVNIRSPTTMSSSSLIGLGREAK